LEFIYLNLSNLTNVFIAKPKYWNSKKNAEVQVQTSAFLPRNIFSVLTDIKYRSSLVD